MKPHIAVFCLCSIMLIPSTSLARDSAPWGFLYGAKDLSHIHFTCHFLDSRGDNTVTKSNVINCEFDQQVLILPPKAEETAQKQAEEDKAFEVAWKQELSKNATTELKKLCTDPKEKNFLAAQENWLKSHKYAALLQPVIEQQRRAVDRLCACTNSACLHDAFKTMSTLETQQKAAACNVILHSWKAKFRRTGEYWVSTSEASMCYSSETVTLSRDKISSEYDWWNMRTVKVPRPDARELCVKETTDYEDSWVKYDIPLTCKTLHFGF